MNLFIQGYRNLRELTGSYRIFQGRFLLAVTWVCSLIIVATGITATEVYAQGDSLSIEEIVVTARKREESLQDTPISVTAIDADAMNVRGMENVSDIGRYVPNVSFNAGAGDAGGSFSSSIYIRGVGQSDYLITTDPGVGIYVDGVYFARSMGSIMDLIDFERIEVLRGPQGTLFGKNTIGGAINIVSGKPGNELNGNLELKIGRWDKLDVKGSIQLPLIEDKLLSRISVISKDADGYGKRIDAENGDTKGELGDTNTVAAQAELLWIVSDDLEINIAADVTNQRAESQVAGLVDTEPTAGLAALWNTFVAPAFGSAIDDRWVSDDPYRVFDSGDSGNDLDAWGVSAIATWNLTNISIKSITAYRELSAFFTTDQDHSPLPYVQTSNDDDQEQFSQELQISGISFDNRLNWLVGAFYFHEKAVDINNAELAPGLFTALESLPAAVVPLAPVMCPAPLPAPCAGGPGNPINIQFDLNIYAFNKISIDSYALFGQATYNITDKFSVTGGVRITKEEKKYTLDHLRTVSGVNVFPKAKVSDDWTSISPRFGFEYKVNDSLMTYISVSKGFKSGGFNGRPIAETELGSFDPEFVWAYEAGIKSEWFNRRMILNMAAFYNDYEDIQLNSVQATPEGNLINITENAGNAKIKGFEVELIARLAPGLDLNASVGHSDFEFTDLDSGATVTRNSSPPHTPSWTYSAGLQYSHKIENVGRLILRGDYAYRTKMFTETANLPIMSQEGYGIVNAHLGLVSEDAMWEFALNGLNLSDEDYKTAGFSTIDSFGLASVTWGRPRSWTMSLTYNF